MDLEHIYKVVGILAIIVFFYTLVAKRIENSSISGPIVYVILGLALGSHGFGLVGSDAEANDLRLLADITLALILFSDAAHSNLSVLKQKPAIPHVCSALDCPALSCWALPERLCSSLSLVLLRQVFLAPC